MHVVIYTDHGDTCDGKARVLGNFPDEQLAISKMKADVEAYCKDSILSITSESDDEIWVGDDDEGCHWQILMI